MVTSIGEHLVNEQQERREVDRSKILLGSGIYWVLVTREEEEGNYVKVPGWTGEALMDTENATCKGALWQQ